VEARPVIGLIGCGNWGANILRDLRSLGCSVIVVGPGAETQARAAAGGATLAFSDVDALPDVDGIVVASPSGTHMAVVDEVLERKVPVFVEKPLSLSLDAIERLARVAPGRVFEMHKWRYHAGIEELARIAASGELGEVVGLRTFRLDSGMRPDDVDAVWHLAPHDLAIALEILGGLAPARAAVADCHAGVVSGLLGILGEDPWLVVELSIRARDYRREVQLLGRDGMAVLPSPMASSLTLVRAAPSDGRPITEQRPISGELPLLRELRAFVDHLEGGPPPRSSLSEAAEVARAITELRSLAGLPT